MCKHPQKLINNHGKMSRNFEEGALERLGRKKNGGASKTGGRCRKKTGVASKKEYWRGVEEEDWWESKKEDWWESKKEDWWASKKEDWRGVEEKYYRENKKYTINYKKTNKQS